MPFLLAIVGGAAVSWMLIETELAIPAFVWILVWTVLLYVAPSLAWSMLGITVVLGLLVVLAAMWEYVLGIILGVFLTIFIIMGVIHAL